MSWNAWLALLFTGALVGTSSIFVVFGGEGPWANWVLDQRGVVVDATPIRVTKTFLSDQQGAVYQVVVQYQDSGGHVHTATFPIPSGEILSQARRERPIRIEYDPEEPSRIRAQGQTANALGTLAWVLYVLWLGAIVGFFVALYFAQRARRIYRDGQATEAVVRELRRTSFQVNNDYLSLVRYDYETPAGSQSGAAKYARPPKVGRSIWVIYDVANPERSVVVR